MQTLLFICIQLKKQQKLSKKKAQKIYELDQMIFCGWEFPYKNLWNSLI